MAIYNVQMEDSAGNQYCPKPDLLTTKEQLSANTAAGKSVDALVVKELSNKLNHVRTYVGSDGKLHSVDGNGADTVLNFNNINKPLRVSGVLTVLSYVSIPTFGHNLRINCTRLKVPSSTGHVYLWGASTIEWSASSCLTIGTLSEGVSEINAKEYEYMLIRYASSEQASFIVTVEWI